MDPRQRTSLALGAALALAACSAPTTGSALDGGSANGGSPANGSGSTSAFAGTWSCSYSDTISGVSEPSPGTGSFVITSTGPSTINIAGSEDSGSTCAIPCTVSGSTATLASEVSCGGGIVTSATLNLGATLAFTYQIYESDLTVTSSGYCTRE
jgi:hypothetical protein